MKPVVSSIFVLFLCANPSHSQDTVTHAITISSYPGYQINAASAASVLNRVRAIIENNDGSGDIDCRTVEFRLEAPPKTSGPNVPLVIDSAASFNALDADGESIYIVEDITWCGGDNLSRILGCAARGGPIAVVPYPEAPIVWAHEIGHGQGLKHFASSPNNLMYPSASSSMTRLTTKQCNAFKSAQLFPLEAEAPQASDRIAEVQALETDDTETAQALEISLDEFLSKAWVHYIPITQIERLSNDEIDRVRTYLTDSSKYNLCPNSVIVMGLRGEDKDLPLLRSVLTMPIEGNMWISHCKINLGRALGFFSNRHDNEEAAALLTSLLYPANNLVYFEGSPTQEADARALARDAAGGMTTVKDGNLATALQAQESSNNSGDIDLNVGPQFYQGLETIREQVSEKGLFEALRAQEVIRGGAQQSTSP